jgi:hypothetical protein
METDDMTIVIVIGVVMDVTMDADGSVLRMQ